MITVFFICQKFFNIIYRFITCIRIPYNHPISRNKKCSYISRLWDELFEEVPDIVQRESRNKNLLLQSRLREMMQFIENHYKERISLERLAADANISKSEALRCFKRGIGTTPVKYLIDYRLERAKELLCKTNDTVIRVAADVGIDNTSYFVRIFKKMYGMTPGAFREEEGLKKAGEK